MPILRARSLMLFTPLLGSSLSFAAHIPRLALPFCCCSPFSRWPRRAQQKVHCYAAVSRGEDISRAGCAAGRQVRH